MKAKEGSKVKVEYVGFLSDGTVFDDSKNHGPLEFTIGSGEVIPGFEKEIIGMEEGEEKEFVLKPEEAYGKRDENLIKEFPKSQLPQGEIKKGTVLMLHLPDGHQMPVEVVEVGEKEVKIDLNHPLAGKELHFKVKLLSVA